MGKLLKAGFYRLGKSKLFWGLIIATAIISGLTFFFTEDEQVILEQKFLSNLNFIPFIIAIFVALFISVEFSEGTIRNKIIVGHNKIQIYLSTFIVNMVASIIMGIVCFITTAIVCAIQHRKCGDKVY